MYLCLASINVPCLSRKYLGRCHILSWCGVLFIIVRNWYPLFLFLCFKVFSAKCSSLSTVGAGSGLSVTHFAISTGCSTSAFLRNTWFTGCNFIWGCKSNFTAILPISFVTSNGSNRFSESLSDSCDYKCAPYKKNLLIRKLNPASYCEGLYFWDVCDSWQALAILNEYWSFSNEFFNLSLKSSTL